MNTLMIFSSILADAFAYPDYYLNPYFSTLSSPYSFRRPGSAPTGPDGRVVDTPEVAQAKEEHALAHINERFTLAYQAAKTAAPLGPDGRVVDLPEVAIAKAQHAAAHLNEKFNRELGANRQSHDYPQPYYYPYSAPTYNRYF